MKRSQKRNKSKSKSKKKQTKKDNGSFKYPITDYISPTNTLNSTFFPYKYPVFDNYYTHYSNNNKNIYYDYSKKKYPIFDNYYTHFSNLNKSSYNSSYACCSQYNDDFDSF